MDQEERPGDQQRRFPQHHNRQDQHISEVEGLAANENGIFAQRVIGALQIIVGREEKALEVPEEYIVEREHGIKEQRIDVLEPVPRRAGFIGGEAKDAASRKRIIFAMEIDAGVMAAMMENTPHVRADSAQIENIVQGFVDTRPGRDGVVIAVMSDVQQKERLREAAYKVEGDK